MLNSLDSSSRQDLRMTHAAWWQTALRIRKSEKGTQAQIGPKLDPSGILTVLEVRVAVGPYQRKYELLIIQDRLDASLDIKVHLRFTTTSIHFHVSQRGVRFRLGALVKYAAPIVCADALFSLCPYTIRQCVSLQIILQLPCRSAKKCKSVEGTAGLKRLCIIEEQLLE